MPDDHQHSQAPEDPVSEVEDGLAGHDAPVEGDAIAAEPEATRRVWRSLLLLAVTGLLISLWLWAFTDHLIIFSSVVALTGIFAWLASLGNILTEQRKKALQRDVEIKLLRHPRILAGVCAAVWLVLLALPFVGGTIVLQSEGDSGTRLYRVVPDAPQPLQAIFTAEGLVKPFEKRKIFLWRFLSYSVKISGIPRKTAALPSPWRWTYERIPHTFYRRPVVLLRPSKPVFDRIRSKTRQGDSLRLDIRKSGEKRSTVLIPAPYLGQAVWLDGDEDLELPGHTVGAWRDELGLAGTQDRVPWLPPIVAKVPMKDVKQLRVDLVNVRTGGENAAPLCFTIDPDPKWETFPQEEVLRLPGGGGDPCP